MTPERLKEVELLLTHKVDVGPNWRKKLVAELVTEAQATRTALQSYHTLARATGHCGPNLSDRCWACAEMNPVA